MENDHCVSVTINTVFSWLVLISFKSEDPQLSSTWFIQRNGRSYGPYDSAKIRAYVASENLKRTDLISKTSNGPWSKADAVKGLFPIVRSSVVSEELPTEKVSAPAIVSLTQGNPNKTARHSVHFSALIPGRYVSATLINGEYVVYQTTLHWVCYIQSAICFLFCVPLVVLFFLTTNLANLEAALLGLIGLWLFLAGLFGVFNVRSSEFAVTNRRVVFKTGVVRRKTSDLLLNKVDSTSLEETLFGRLLGYATVTVTVAVEKSKYSRIKNPIEFVRFVQNQQSEALGGSQARDR